MRRRLRPLLLVLVIGGLAVLLLCMLLFLYLAARHEPAFYREAMKADHTAMKQDSDRMLRKAASLQSVLRKPGRWELCITADEINGWLAVDLAENHPDALPQTMKDPRVSIRPDAITVACRFDQDGANSILSLTIQPYAGQTANESQHDETSVVAVRIIAVRAGLLPLPLEKVLDGLSRAARDMGLHLDWRRSGGNPVAMIAVPDGDDELVVRIETLRLGEGELFLTGVTERRKP